MYGVVIGALTVVLPVASIVIEAILAPGAGITGLVGKWFAFWAVGIRLLLAGVSQVMRPAATAQGILGIRDAGAGIVVQELGFANLSIGLLGAASLLVSSWVVPAAIAGGLFLGLAGVRHMYTAERGRKEAIAMVTDLFVAYVLAGFLGLRVAG